MTLLAFQVVVCCHIVRNLGRLNYFSFHWLNIRLCSPILLWIATSFISDCTSFHTLFDLISTISLNLLVFSCIPKCTSSFIFFPCHVKLWVGFRIAFLTSDWVIIVVYRGILLLKISLTSRSCGGSKSGYTSQRDFHS